MAKAAVVEIEEPAATTLDEDALVQKALSDPAAFAALYRRYAAGVYRYLFGRVGNLQDAEDLTTQVFLEVLESLPRYRPEGKFAAWLFTIALHRRVDHHRRDRGHVPLDWVDDLITLGNDGSAGLVQRESLERLASLFNQLDEDKQELIRLRYAAGLTYRQIAQVLGRSEAAIGMALHRLIHWFNDHWEDQDE
jgi:RNA polymerase sigma-70 factor (ECF subfamily)